jgi:response regulator NasT
MRVAIIKNNGHIDKRIERLLSYSEIKGDFISKFTRNSLNMYHCVIFTHKNNIQNLPKVIESIVLEKKILVIYINNTLSIGEFYNVMNDLYFSVINEQNLEIELLSVINNSVKYINEINRLNLEKDRVVEELKTINNVSKAKRSLMSKGFTEDEAHKFIQRKAMDLRLSKLETANLIIENKIDI